MAHWLPDVPRPELLDPELLDLEVGVDTAAAVLVGAMDTGA